MNIKRKNLPKSQVELTIEIVQSEMLEYIDKTQAKLAKMVTVPGFRRGEAPKELVTKHISSAELLNESIEYAVNESYKKAIAQEQLSPLANPEIKLSEKESENGLQYTAVISVMPSITLPDYKKIAKGITKESEDITEKDVEEAKKYLQKSRGTQQIVEREAQKGDTVSIDYILTVDGKEFDKSEKMPVEIGAGKFIPGFEDHIIGLKAGESKEFDIPFPQDYHNLDLAGKSGHFAVKVQEVQEIQLPAWDEAFAKELSSGQKTIDELEQNLRDGLIAERKQEIQTSYTQSIVDGILSTITVELPDVLVFAERDQIIQEMEQRALYSGQTLDDALTQAGKTREALLEEAIPQAESRVKLMLILKAITEEQQFVPDTHDVQHRISHILEKYPKNEHDQIDMNRLRIMVEGEITDKMALDYLGSL